MWRLSECEWQATVEDKLLHMWMSKCRKKTRVIWEWVMHSRIECAAICSDEPLTFVYVFQFFHLSSLCMLGLTSSWVHKRSDLEGSNSIVAYREKKIAGTQRVTFNILFLVNITFCNPSHPQKWKIPSYSSKKNTYWNDHFSIPLFSQVCATDNKTYESSCHFFATKCTLEGTKKGHKLHLDYIGPCKCEFLRSLSSSEL